MARAPIEARRVDPARTGRADADRAIGGGAAGERPGAAIHAHAGEGGEGDGDQAPVPVRARVDPQSTAHRLEPALARCLRAQRPCRPYSAAVKPVPRGTRQRRTGERYVTADPQETRRPAPERGPRKEGKANLRLARDDTSADGRRQERRRSGEATRLPVSARMYLQRQVLPSRASANPLGTLVRRQAGDIGWSPADASRRFNQSSRNMRRVGIPAWTWFANTSPSNRAGGNGRRNQKRKELISIT